MITLQYISHYELSGLDLDGKMKRILRSVKDDRIVLVDGRLHPHEEVELISRTMEQIDKKFSGIEICSVESRKKSNELLFVRLRRSVANFLLGKSDGLTIIGPASIVKEIKKDPYKIELFMKSSSQRRRTKGM